MSSAYISNVTTLLPANESSDVPINKSASGTAVQAFLDLQNTILGLKTDVMTVRPFHKFKRDVEPELRGTIRFGDRVVFKFGQEFPGAIVGQEFIVRLPKLFRTDGAFTPANGNPQDAGYVAAGGDAGDFLQWRPNIGELLIGGLNEYLEQKHGQEVLDRIRPLEISVRRRLIDNDNATSTRTAYLNGIGGSAPLATNQPIDLIIRINTPWGAANKPLNVNRYWPTHAFSLDMEYSFRLPPLNELTHARFLAPGIDVSSINVSTQALMPSLFLRNHFFNTPQDQKQLDVMATMNGIRLKVNRMITERTYEFDANAASEVEVTIDLESAKLPVAYVVATLRYKDDTRKTGEIAAFTDLEPDLLKKRTFLKGGQEVLVRPNQHRFLPITRWWIQDQSERHTDVKDMHTWLNSGMEGFSCLFPSTPTEQFAVIAASTAPADEENCFGHFDFTTFHKPRLHLVLPPNDANNASQRRVVNVMFVYYNVFEVRNGQGFMSIAHPLTG